MRRSAVKGFGSGNEDRCWRRGQEVRCLTRITGKILCLFILTFFCLSAAECPAETLQAEEPDTVTIPRELYERYRKMDTLMEIMDMVDSYYYEEADESGLLDGAAAGLLESLGDPYTFYYTAESFASYMEHQQGQYAGIGIQISTSYVTRTSTISRVFAGSPAEAAGVQRGDILYQVEDLMVTPETIQDAVSIMRGIPGTTVQVTFLRGDEKLEMTVGRAQIAINRVESCMLPSKIGYIRLWEFMGDCAQRFREAYDALKAEGMEGLILDLRDNPGGLLNDALAIGDIFLDSGILTYIEYRGGMKQYYRTTDGAEEIPLCILINENSASCSELLAGALRDRLGCRVIGVTSFGKGVVQRLLQVDPEGAAMQLTIAQYFTPSGTAVHHIGIEPDIVSTLPEGDHGMYQLGDTADPQLKAALDDMTQTLSSTRKKGE